VVEASRTGSWPRCQELLQQRRRELVEPAGAALTGETQEQPELGLLAAVLASQRPAAGQEPLHGRCQGLAHRSTSSPSPSETCRSDSMATLA